MTSRPEINTLGLLKTSGYTVKSIKDELRDNLKKKILNKKNVFEGIFGYENTVIPQLEQAILSRHNINLLGLRGQAKTRLARMMTTLLDEWIPFVAGSEINDDPLNPISRFAKELIEAEGDNTPIEWLHRDERFFEKLATPDVTVADLIGDVDPIKAANLKLSYADDRVIHFGMIPRANRSIFVINELPDLQARIQVSLFNILQEGDVQIRGFKVRMPLDIQFVFTANPEDYTNRGSIVTPLKDRIGSQILTHYPENIQTAKEITKYESSLDGRQNEMVYVPELAKDLLEQINFEARESEYVDAKSGVSARMSITAFENLLSTAERRALITGDEKTSVRLSDFVGIVPAITGKVELVYEGEQEGAEAIAELLIDNAVRTIFGILFPKIEKLQKKDAATPYDQVLNWFTDDKGFLEITDNSSDENYIRQLNQITPLDDLINEFRPETDEKDRLFLKEFVLWGLAVSKKLNKERFRTGVFFS
ncbi:sigma 54-interacting transcriptional regulator [Chryseobacterium sp. Leaf394]|uniref:sigma 54-interacting transcriptional regulator n=1 Tax=Chryseobacterium sp. Leaf394 TaxID=1736361 RepID=UPI0006F993C4|nr:sigma 54-interacting transcriptional regulator [Chryseobacterium sp. Leaf394]KQS89133.1 magnesium chelatase [Chryseobacterium sp. Leaf394]